MAQVQAFKVFGPSHLIVLGVTAALAAGLSLAARRSRGGRLPRVIAWTLAAVLLADEVVVIAMTIATDRPHLTDHLPFQLCDWVIFACAVALVARRQLAYELAWFWGLAGTLQALLTPDLREDFPSLHFFTFQILHAGVVVAVLYLTCGLAMRPTWRSLGRAWLGLQVFLVATAGVDRLLDANYGYLRAKPAQASLFDYLGPWPWYLITVEAVALVLFAACYAPFALLDRLRPGGASPNPSEP